MGVELAGSNSEEISVVSLWRRPFGFEHSNYHSPGEETTSAIHAGPYTFECKGDVLACIRDTRRLQLPGKDTSRFA